MQENHYNIPVEATLEVIGGKWKVLILCHLKNKKMRFSELQRAIPQITKKMLTQQLRELEYDGIIIRYVYQQVPPKVEYSLSHTGESLREVLNIMCAWGEKRITNQI
ncbi:winged helix-turn-helix transcriptional regulator [Rummeliibacillus stabekisii]|uniref:MarR family transcriptional regulator n=1 Tax=Rummeliibacillus stabekisii TaxID=241244 RepID=A0A143HDH0_9BACL|nr:helix-turn-helix domain-containing protein [Rummeliibacillus stabekisii]AMW99536.1 MarR family transcriptional regulator [Rummeliibacillus stabekisii]